MTIPPRPRVEQEAPPPAAPGEAGAPFPRTEPEAPRGRTAPELPLPRLRPEVPRPRIQQEELPAARLEADPVEMLASAPRTGTGALILGGIATLLLSVAGLAVANFVADQFARAEWLGWLTLLLSASGFSLIGTGLWRELHGLRALGAVDQVRADLASGDPLRIQGAARRWTTGLPEAQPVAAAVRTANDPDAVLALLRAGPADALRARADALGRQAAVQMVAGIAAMPSPALDVALITWRSVRLVRQVAALYGMRPGLLGTMSLLRRTASSAMLVGAAEVAANAAARAVLSNPLLGHALGEMAGAGVAARRMMVLARASAAACDPVPPA